MPFRDLEGHRVLLGLLSRAVARDSLPPSLLFSGPDGVGKRTTALALAQALNCTTPVTEAPSSSASDATAGSAADGRGRPSVACDACGTCASCRRIARGVHSDVLNVEPGETGSIRIEQVRTVIDAAGYRPFEGRRRVVIIDAADGLVPEAQDALLKTLEEPPSRSVFVLVSDRPDELQPTIRSRCPQMRFGPLEVAEIVGVLVRDHGLAEADARAAAAAAKGSVARALEIQAGEGSAARDTAARFLADLAGRPGARIRFERAKELAAAPRKRGRDASREAGDGGDRADTRASREAMTARLRALSLLLRDLQVLATRADERWLANTDLAPGLAPLAARYPSDRVARAFSAVDHALDAIQRNASPKSVADWLAFQF